MNAVEDRAEAVAEVARLWPNSGEFGYGAPEENTSSETVVWMLTGCLREDGPRFTIPVGVNPFRIGRHVDNTLTVDNPTVSARHAEILCAGEELLLRDAGSTNGTFVNGNRVTLAEPLADGDLVQFGTAVFRLTRQVGTPASDTNSFDVQDQALAMSQFGKMLSERSVLPYFQPIVEVATSRIVGFEVLARSRLAGLTNPAAMFRAAVQFNAEVALSQLMRQEGLKAAGVFPGEMIVLLNTHPADIEHPDLLPSLAAARRQHPERPIVLEIHEAALAGPAKLRELRAALGNLDIRIAYDDFGSGQARLLELIEGRPDYVKFEMGMIRSIDKAERRYRQLVVMLARIVRGVGAAPLAKGVETAEEAEACREVGFELAQGFFYGRPASAGAWAARLA